MVVRERERGEARVLEVPRRLRARALEHEVLAVFYRIGVFAGRYILVVRERRLKVADYNVRAEERGRHVLQQLAFRDAELRPGGLGEDVAGSEESYVRGKSDEGIK